MATKTKKNDNAWEDDDIWDEIKEMTNLFGDKGGIPPPISPIKDPVNPPINDINMQHNSRKTKRPLDITNHS